MDRAEFFTKLPTMSLAERQMVQHAYDLATLAHKHQYRDTGEPYFTHAQGVAMIMVEYGHADAHQITLSLLHDVVEETFILFSLLELVFGSEIAMETMVLSKSYGVEDPDTGFIIRTPKRLPEVYFGGIFQSTRRVALTKCGDKIHNLSKFPDPEDEQIWTQERRVGQVEETRRYIIPLAERHDPRMALRLKQLCDELEATAQRIISTRPPPHT